MTSPLHKQAVAARLNRFLSRRSMPRAIEGREQAIADELDALVATVARYAPQQQDALADWWPKFESDLGERNITRSWPSEGEISASCKAVTATPIRRPANGDEVDPEKINANRIREGLPVGDSWVWGRGAADLIRGGHVTEEHLRPYRSSLFFAECDVVKKPEAQRREAERKQHFAAVMAETQSTARYAGNPALAHTMPRGME